jgi:AraC family transcriptional regulator of adaptative response / DNA-3-methyladenine glycosylase II
MVLGYRAPYDVAALLKFFAQRAIPGVESVAGQALRRSVRAGVLADEAGWISARFDATAARVQIQFSPQWAMASARIAAAARRWLDLDAAPQTIDAALADVPGAAGRRLPGSLDGFELGVRAVLGQQVTVAAARTLARRLVERFGSALATPWPDVERAFPAPHVLSQARVEQIAELGIIRSRAAAIIALARAWPELDAMLKRRAPPEQLIESLCALPGVGPWTAHYIAMRAMSWPDAFPPGDVAVLKAMQRSFGVAGQAGAQARAAGWRPWRAYAVLRLWNSLENDR